MNAVTVFAATTPLAAAPNATTVRFPRKPVVARRRPPEGRRQRAEVARDQFGRLRPRLHVPPPGGVNRRSTRNV